MKNIFLCLVTFSTFAFALSSDEINCYIKENSQNLDKLCNVLDKIYPSNPTLLHLLYVIAPEKIAGANFEWNKYERTYIREDVLSQPVVGGFFGRGKIPNAEMLLKLNPQLILVNKDIKNQTKIDEIFGPMAKPTLYLNATTLQDYIDGFEILGAVTGKTHRAKEVADYGRKTLNLAQALEKFIIKHNLKKPRIYYAQGSDGLQTECAGSLHAALIELSGGENVHKCSIQNSFGRIKISFEQLLSYQPDTILIYEEEFLKNIRENPKWQLLNAVKNGKFYLIAREPFSWFDRPPSFMRFLGLKWLIDINFPQAFKFDMRREIREFYKLFLQVDLDDSQIDKILTTK
ncbi:MAG: ABC transporter substrate-binding protein [Campylobacter sp.]